LSSHFLVCPFEEKLIQRLRGKSIVPVIKSIEDLPTVVGTVEKAGAHLHCLQICTKAPLSTLPFEEEWRHVPIALYTPSLGRFPEFIRRLPIIRQLNLRVYLSTASDENYTSIRILSSLGIETAVVFQQDKIEWGRLLDLMSYAFFAQAPHAGIAPFHYVTTRYKKNERTDFGAVYFGDPWTYLHLDKQGRVALSAEDLEAGHFLFEDIEKIEKIDENQNYLESLEKWREIFLHGFGCASCPGWRICLGKFSRTAPNGPGCREFFAEMMDRVEKYQEINRQLIQQKILWQP
jgi:hypothetical protein